MSETEGVIKYLNQHATGNLPESIDIDAINQWFVECRKRNLIGQNTTRYGGYAYGNISQRNETGFIISGTQTGGLKRLSPQQIALVLNVDVENNKVLSEGPIAPSSETMTHGQIYQTCPQASFVIHIHDPIIWKKAQLLQLPTTAPDIEFGTIEMANAVNQLLIDTGDLPAAFAMLGHEDGIIVYGSSPDQCGKKLLQLYQQAYNQTL